MKLWFIQARQKQSWVLAFVTVAAVLAAVGIQAQPVEPVAAGAANAGAAGAGSDGCKNDESCPDSSGSPSADDCEEDDCEEGSSTSASYVNPYSRVYIHYANDYETPVRSPQVGCAPCGASGSNVGQLPSLTLKRMHKPHTEPFGSYGVSSFGRGVGLGIDSMLRLTEPASGAPQIRLYDYDSTGPYTSFLSFSNRPGRYVGQPANGHTILLYLADGTRTTDQASAVTAELNYKDGRKRVYEVFAPDANNASFLAARITSIQDRNGNAVTVTYAHGVAESQAAGFDLRRMWIKNAVTDAYGNTAQFVYGAQPVSPPGAPSQFVVTRIDLPNGEHLTYDYNNFGELSQVNHPDGTVSTFATTPDDEFFAWRLSIFDPAAETTHRRKTVFLTRAGMHPSGMNQAFGRVIRILNGSGELSYAVWDTDHPSDNTLRYTHVFSGGNKIQRFTVRRATTELVSSEVSRSLSTDASGNTVIEYELKTTNPQFAARNLPGQTMDVLGRMKSRAWNRASNLLASRTAPDGSTSSTTYVRQVIGGFNQTRSWPLVKTDSLGRRTAYTYDSNGNPLTETLAQGATGVGEEGVTTYTYNAAGQPTTMTDRNGNVTNYFYSSTGSPTQLDGSGFLVIVEQPADRAGDPRARSLYAYDSAGRLSQSTDPQGREMVYTYDARNRVAQVRYPDSSVETFTYGAPGSGNENLVVEQTDRNGNLTRRAYDAHGRVTQVTEAFGTPESVTTDTTYLPGTGKVLTRSVKGEQTTYVYDAQNRVVQTQRQTSGGSVLTSANLYDGAQRMRGTQDPYGRRTFYVYDVNDNPVRTVTETLPGSVALPAADDLTPAQIAQNDAHLLALLRGLGGSGDVNAPHLIQDTVYDAAGQQIARVDARGVLYTHAYDQQGRRTETVEDADPATLTALAAQVGDTTTFTADRLQRIGGLVAGGDPFLAAKTRQVYDPQGNVVAQHSPRFFDASDTQGHNQAQVTMTYTGRNLLASRTEAPGTADEATQSFSYHLDQRADTTTDGRGSFWRQLWHRCCGRFQASIDPLGHGQVSNTDFYGNVTHTASVQDVLSHDTPSHGGSGNPGGFHDPLDDKTLSETTTRYDARHRPVASTRWLVPLGNVDPNAVPIAGGGQAGDPEVEVSGVLQGLTTTYTYDDDLTDGQGLEAAYGPQIAQLGAGFFAAGSDGYGVAMTNPEGEVTVSVVDGAGRTVLSIDPEGDASRVEYDAVQNVPASGSLLLTRRTDPLGHVTQAFSDGAGRTLQIVDAEGHATVYRYDGNSNRVSFRDANGVGEDCVYDARNRETQCRDTQELAEATVRTTAYDANHNVVRTTDAKGADDTCLFDARDRQVSCTDRIGAVTVNTYDPNSNLLSITDAQGGETRYTYDPRNLQTLTEYPGHAAGSTPGNAGYDAVAMSYDALQRPGRKTDQSGDTCDYVYDLASRLTQKQYAARVAAPRPRSPRARTPTGPLTKPPVPPPPTPAKGRI